MLKQLPGRGKRRAETAVPSGTLFKPKQQRKQHLMQQKHHQ
jgi:hypothetical protein